MALYSYQALTKDGKKVSGVMDASSVNNVKEQLTRQGFFPINITATQSEKKFSLSSLFSWGVSQKTLILFTRQLAILLKSGVPLLQAFDLLIEQFEGRFKNIVSSIRENLREGMSLADAMRQYPQVFENIYVQLVRAGEASGKLEAILFRLTDYIERRANIRKKITGALQYPLIQLVIALGVVIILLNFVVPQMSGLFEEQGKQLPLSTRILLGISGFFTNHYLLLIISVVATIFAWLWFRRTLTGSRLIDKTILKTPLIGYISRTNAVVQFSYTLGILLESGVNLAQALDIVTNIIDNQTLKSKLEEARDKIIKQGKIAQYLKETNMFPPIAIYLIKTGEESGQLDQMLLTVAKNYEEDLTELIDRATGLISPIMLIVMAVLIGFIITALMAPITGAGKALGIENV